MRYLMLFFMILLVGITVAQDDYPPFPDMPVNLIYSDGQWIECDEQWMNSPPDFMEHCLNDPIVTDEPANDAPAIDHPLQVDEPLTVQPITYVVEYGDNWYSIARQFNVKVEDIWNLNGVTDPTAAIHRGNIVEIPES